MKKQLSLVLAVLMLCCSVFGSGITGFAGIKVADAQELKLNEAVNLQTTYDASSLYETAHCWTTFTTTDAGSYVFLTTCSDEDCLITPLAWASKSDAEKMALATVIEAEGMVFKDDYTYGYVLNLKANKTYYVDMVSLNFENQKAEPALSVKVQKHTHNYKSYAYEATTDYDGETGKACSTCYAEKDAKAIPSIETVKLSATSYTYDGKAKTPSVTVKDRTGKKLTKGTDYTVTYPKKRTSVGKYTVTIKFKGKYAGTEKKTFTIKPSGTSITSVSAAKKAFTVKWKKQTKQTTGYQIQYSRYKDFTNPTNVTVANNKTTSKKVSKLLAKKKYYVRVRTYKTVKVNGKSTKIYSSWSKVKTVTTKK